MHVVWKVLTVAILTAGVPLLMGANGCGGGGLVSIDEQTEVQIGQQAAADIERQYGVVNDPTQTARIQRIGRNIATVSQRPNLPWSFRILNSNTVNAISLPGGPIYLTRGLLNQGVTDAEIAGVLGHEIAHVNQRHSVKAIERGMTYQLLSELVLGRSSAALRTAANLAVEYAVQLPRSRDDEYESDSIGIRLAYNAGYPANGLVQFLQRLETLSGPNRTPEWMSTHPLTRDRIVRAQEIATDINGDRRPVPIALTEQEQREITTLAKNNMEEQKQITPP